MPGIFTHYAFALDVEKRVDDLAGCTPDERDAFRLGSQGPDPLFFAAAGFANPAFLTLGTKMHKEQTDRLLKAVSHAWRIIAKRDQGIARSYSLGFMCHYLLDSSVHPLVYAQQYAYCDAQVAGLDAKCSKEVHATIEMEFDEVMITRIWDAKKARDIAGECLKASGRVLDVVSRLYAIACATTYNLAVPREHFTKSVKGYRVAERFIDKAKQNGTLPQHLPFDAAHFFPWMRALGHSFAGLEQSDFFNEEHWEFEHPFCEGVVNASFDELFEGALTRACKVLPVYLDADLDDKAIHELTGGLNFDGAPSAI